MGSKTRKELTSKRKKKYPQARPAISPQIGQPKNPRIQNREQQKAVNFPQP